MRSAVVVATSVEVSSAEIHGWRFKQPRASFRAFTAKRLSLLRRPISVSTISIGFWFGRTSNLKRLHAFEKSEQLVG